MALFFSATTILRKSQLDALGLLESLISVPPSVSSWAQFVEDDDWIKVSNKVKRFHLETFTFTQLWNNIPTFISNSILSKTLLPKRIILVLLTLVRLSLIKLIIHKCEFSTLRTETEQFVPLTIRKL